MANCQSHFGLPFLLLNQSDLGHLGVLMVWPTLAQTDLWLCVCLCVSVCVCLCVFLVCLCVCVCVCVGFTISVWGSKFWFCHVWCPWRVSRDRPSQNRPSRDRPKISLFFFHPLPPPGLAHDKPENSKRAHLSAPASNTKFNEKTPREGREERILWREREKKARNFGAPLRGPTLSGPRPSPPPFPTHTSTQTHNKNLNN